MIPARTTLHALDLSSAAAEREEALPETEAEIKLFEWRGWVGWARTYFFSRSTTEGPEEIILTPRSYSTEFKKLFIDHRDPAFMRAFLDRALRLLPLHVLVTSEYFWADRHIEYICQKLTGDPETYQALLRLTPKEFYIQYPAHCQTEKQVEMMLDEAYGDPAKLEDITDAVLIAIGDERNTYELDQLYYYYLRLLAQRKGSDAYIAERLNFNWQKLEQKTISALQKIENVPNIQNVIDQNRP